MAVKDFMKPGFGPRMGCTILTVDPQQRKIEAILKDGAAVQVAVFDTPGFFVWPKVNERWTIHRVNGIWMLNHRLGTEDDYQIDDLQPGEGKIDADIIKTPSGKSVVIVDDSKVTAGQVIGYKNGTWTPIDQTGGTGGTSTGTANTIRYGSGVPSSSTGSNGDFYIDTSANAIYGPKASGAWPSGTSLIGSQGSPGATGATGATGAAGTAGAAGAAGVIQSISPTSGSPITVVGGTTANPTIGITKGGTTSGDIVTIDGSQTLTNKSISGSQINSGTVASARLPSNVAYTDSANTFTANQNLNSNKLTSVTDPTAAQDAATKNYVDTNQRDYVKTTSATSTGPATLHRLDIRDTFTPSNATTNNVFSGYTVSPVTATKTWNFRFSVSALGSGVSIKVGVWSSSGDGSFNTTLLGSTGIITPSSISALTTGAFSSSFTLTAGTAYYVGMGVTWSTTAPTIRGFGSTTANTAALPSHILVLTPIMTSSGSWAASGNTLPVTNLLNNQQFIPWIELY